MFSITRRALCNPTKSVNVMHTIRIRDWFGVSFIYFGIKAIDNRYKLCEKTFDYMESIATNDSEH